MSREFWRPLLTDPRSVRAIDETLQDIRAERASAGGVGARFAWAMQAVAALARVGVRVSLFELGAIAPGAWAIRLLLWTALPVALLAVDPLRRLRLPDGVPAWVAVTLLPQALTVVLPFSMFWTNLWPPRASKPRIFLSSVIAVVIVLASVVATPRANQQFRTVVFAANGGQGRLSPGIPEMSLMELARVGFLDSDLRHEQSMSLPARRQFVLLTGLVGLAGSWAAAGCWLARMRGRRWPWAIALPSTLLLTVIPAGWAGAFWALAFASLPVVRWWSSRHEASRAG